MGDLAKTGFGTVTSDTCREFVKQGIDVRILSQNETDKLPEPFASRTLAPAVFDMGAEGIEEIHPYLRQILEGQAAELKLHNGEDWGDWKPDVLFLLGDYYGMRDMVEAAGRDLFKKIPTFHYVPIEGEELPPMWNELWKFIKPIAMTRFGQDQIEKIVGYRPPMVYHGVDSEMFHPVSPTNPVRLPEKNEKGEMVIRTMTSKAACKVFMFGDPSITLAMRTDRFMPRKGYDALIRTMAPVLRTHSNLRLLLHCRSRDFGGFIPDILSKYPDVREQIFVPDFFAQYGPVPRSLLVVMYNAADLYVTVSAEGFGLTIAEAIACGTPAVGLDYSAVPEVIGPAGRVVPVGRLLDNEYAHRWALPDEDEYARAVTYLLDHPHKRLEMGRMGPGHVQRNFRWDVAAQRFTKIAQDALGATETGERVMVAA